MKPVIHLFGASGSGTTTLGRALSEALHLRHLDTDDYYWLPTDPKFTAKRPIPERLMLMNADIDSAEHGTVISGSLTGWGDPLTPRFTLAVRVVTDSDIRLERLRTREYARFGERILPGGDMHQQHQDFLAWAAQYDDGDVHMRSRANHDLWQQGLSCPVLAVDGAHPLDALVRQVTAAVMGVRPMVIADYDALRALWLATPGMGLNDVDDSREGIARYLARNPNTCFVAEADGQLTGAIMAGHDGRRGYIYHTCVRADVRGRGLGRVLVEAALAALQAEGICKAALVVFARNEGGNAFWERMGFTERKDLTYRNRTLAEMVRIDT